MTFVFRRLNATWTKVKFAQYRNERRHSSDQQMHDAAPSDGVGIRKGYETLSTLVMIYCSHSNSASFKTEMRGSQDQQMHGEHLLPSQKINLLMIRQMSDRTTFITRKTRIIILHNSWSCFHIWSHFHKNNCSVGCTKLKLSSLQNFKRETNDMSCTCGKVILSALPAPLDHLNVLLEGTAVQSKNFLNYIRY